MKHLEKKELEIIFEEIKKSNLNKNIADYLLDKKHLFLKAFNESNQQIYRVNQLDSFYAFRELNSFSEHIKWNFEKLEDLPFHISTYKLDSLTAFEKLKDKFNEALNSYPNNISKFTEIKNFISQHNNNFYELLEKETIRLKNGFCVFSKNFAATYENKDMIKSLNDKIKEINDINESIKNNIVNKNENKKGIFSFLRKKI